MRVDLKPRKDKHGKQKAVERLTGARHLRSIVVFAMFAVLDVLLFVLALQGMAWLLILRGALALLTAHLAQPISSLRPWSSRQALIALTCFLMPGVGGLMAVYWSTRVTKVQGAWMDVPTAQEAYRSPIDWGGVLDVVPLIDVLEGSDPKRKKGALLQAQSMQSEIQVPVVRIALDDDDPEVRYYGASLLSRAEAVHSIRIRQLERELESKPEDVETWNKLAEEYGQIIEGGIAGAELSRFYLDKRIGVLNQSLSLDPDQPNVGIEKAQTLFLLNADEEAEQEAKRWLETSDSDVTDRALGVLIQIAYQRNDQQSLVRAVQQVSDRNQLSEAVRGLVHLWEGGEKKA
ncbi:hypothetical protein CIG75_09715 [Tumebacillus algifaecis]|uniref:HEAT repeat domain-containing protein n=1 Tax=Tumebacillus algifaecis TaxID=1214604 RepID=A0A223D0U2_9BACL|nr:hypothetical protein [Tumebacillus algifaecis]ASS75230.1 hypothetical protein CIG75_09715 [Tumebacillus algifaecis]